jgi:LysR family transcriptional regulator, glycine cleavage system transcriptional activator
MASPKQITTTAGLRALEAVARLGSLSAAAREMGVTPAAISHRLRDVEAVAGQPLVYRHAGRFLPTESGVRVIAALGDAFARLRAADTVLQGLSAASILRVVAPMSFTVLWLLPRLAGFEADHPTVTPYVAAASEPLRQEGDPPDVRIAHGVDRPAGNGWESLIEDVTAVAFAPGRGSDLRQLIQGRAVHIDSPGGLRAGTLGWADWLRAMGLDLPPPPGLHVSAEHVAADIAVQGGAAMLASLFTLADHFADGRLQAAKGSGVRAGIRYWMRVERPGPTSLAFADWLRGAVLAHQSGPMRVGLGQVGL